MITLELAFAKISGTADTALHFKNYLIGVKQKLVLKQMPIHWENQLVSKGFAGALEPKLGEEIGERMKPTSKLVIFTRALSATVLSAFFP